MADLPITVPIVKGSDEGSVSSDLLNNVVTPVELEIEVTAREQGDRVLSSRIDDLPAPPAPHYLGAYDNLLQQIKDNVNLGNIVLRYGRFWIVHERNNARANGPLSAIDDGWRAIDGQYRIDAPAQSRIYDGGDHTYVGDNLYFCRIGGNYTSAQIIASDNWDNLTLGSVDPQPGGVTAAQLAAEVTARSEGDTALGTRINQNDSNIGEEIRRRQEGDVALGTRIDEFPVGVTPNQLGMEVSAREHGDATLVGLINNLPDTDAQFQEEALQRSNADIALGNRIDDIPPPGITLGQATAAAQAATALWSHRHNADQIPANKLGNAAQATARNEVLVPFRPGANPALILIQSIGYVTAADGYTEYNAPFYISDGGYTLNASEARDFAGEPHLVSLLSGGGPPAAGPIVSGDSPALSAAVLDKLIWEPTQRRLSRVRGHNAVTQVVDWGENALPPGHVFEIGKTYQGIAEHRTDLPHVIPAANVYFLRESNTYTTGTSDGHATQYVPPGDLGAFGFKDEASDAVTNAGQYAAFVDPDTGNNQVFPWQVLSFVAGDPAEWHLDPYVPASLLSVLTEKGPLVHVGNVKVPPSWLSTDDIFFEILPVDYDENNPTSVVLEDNYEYYFVYRRDIANSDPLYVESHRFTGRTWNLLEDRLFLSTTRTTSGCLGSMMVKGDQLAVSDTAGAIALFWIGKAQLNSYITSQNAMVVANTNWSVNQPDAFELWRMP